MLVIYIESMCEYHVYIKTMVLYTPFEYLPLYCYYNKNTLARVTVRPILTVTKSRVQSRENVNYVNIFGFVEIISQTVNQNGNVRSTDVKRNVVTVSHGAVGMRIPVGGR